MQNGDISYILHHLGENAQPYGAVSPPIYQTSIFSFPDFASFQEALNDEVNHPVYTRGNNPTVMLAEQKLAALEGAERAKLVSSGVAAIAHAIMAQVKSGDNVVCVEDCYSWTRTLLSSYLPRFGISARYVEGSDVNALFDACSPQTKVIYLESPTTFTFKLQDIPEIASEARRRGIKTIIDNTWATPIFCKPLELGIDMVIHSGSKYFGGASDCIAGVIAGSKADIDIIQAQEFLQMGTVPDPFMAWLLLRGLRTLHIRMNTHFANALAVCSFLQKHPAVENVLYPFWDTHPQYALAQKLYRGGSGLFSILLKPCSYEEIIRFTNRLNLFKRAVSWGGYESLVFPYAVKYRKPQDIPAGQLGLVRFHAGLEESSLLIEDLEQALQR